MLHAPARSVLCCGALKSISHCSGPRPEHMHACAGRQFHHVTRASTSKKSIHSPGTTKRADPGLSGRSSSYTGRGHHVAPAASVHCPLLQMRPSPPATALTARRPGPRQPRRRPSSPRGAPSAPGSAPPRWSCLLETSPGPSAPRGASPCRAPSWRLPELQEPLYAHTQPHPARDDEVNIGGP